MAGELPLATPVIMAGIRIATVTTIGLVAVTALIGQGGLGFVIITLGIRRQFETAIVVGVILSVLLAVLADRGPRPPRAPAHALAAPAGEGA